MQDSNFTRFIEKLIYSLAWVGFVILGLTILLFAGIGGYVLYVVSREVIGI